MIIAGLTSGSRRRCCQAPFQLGLELGMLAELPFHLSQRLQLELLGSDLFFTAPHQSLVGAVAIAHLAPFTLQGPYTVH